MILKARKQYERFSPHTKRKGNHGTYPKDAKTA